MTADFFDRLEDQLRLAVVAQHAVAQPRRHRPRRRAILAAAVLAPCAVALAALTLAGAFGSGSAGPAPASAAQLLRRAATAAARQPAEPPLRAGQLHYSRELESQTVEFGHGHSAIVAVRVERWVDPRGRARARVTPLGAPAFFTAADRRAWVAGGRPRLPTLTATSPLIVGRPGRPFHVGPRLLSFAQLRALPATPRGLRAVLARYAREYGARGAAAPSYEFLFATQLMRGTPASPALRAAAFRVLASLPGVRAEGTVYDHLARPGTAVSIVWADLRYVVIFDTASARLLEERFLSHAGRILDFTTQEATKIVPG